MLVHMGSVINVNKVLIWFTYGCLAIIWHIIFLWVYNWNRDCDLGRTSMDEWSASHNTHKRQTSIPPLVFEPTVLATERLQTQTQDRAATGICSHYIIGVQKFQLLMWCSGSDSIVGIVVCYGLDGLGQHSLHPSRPTLEPTQPPIQRVLGLFPGIKWPGPVVLHPPPPPPPLPVGCFILLSS